MAVALAAGACAGTDSELVAFEVAGDNPVANSLWCEADDLVADLSSTPSFPPSIEVRPLDERDAQRLTDDFVATVFADAPAANAGREFVHDGGPVAAMVLTWPDFSDERGTALPGGWLTFALVSGEWTVTGYSACNRFAFGV